jgi:hypothetical protein
MTAAGASRSAPIARRWRSILAAGRDLIRAMRRFNHGGGAELAAGLPRRAAARSFKAFLARRYREDSRCC